MKSNRRTIQAIAGTAVVFAIVASAAQAQQGSIPVPSRWQGRANVAIAGRIHSLPAVLEITHRGPEEANPVRVFLGVGNQANVGSCLLVSAAETMTPYTFRQLTLQYMNVQWRGSSFSAVLSNTQSDLASVLNSFTSPNVSAAYAPEHLKGMYSTMPLGTESFYFHAGTALTAKLDGQTLVGSVTGVGSSYTAIFSTPKVEYAAAFRLVRVQ